VLALIPQLQGWWGWHPSRGFSCAERLMTQAHVLAFYLKLFFIPIPGTMSLFHDNFPITHAVDGTTLVLIAGYMAAVVGAIALRDRAPWIGFGILWFLTCHLLESTLIPLELVFEHRNYLAILGLCIGLVGASAWVLSRLDAQRIGPYLLAAVLVILSFNTAVRAKDWSDMGRLLAVELQRDPTSPRVLWGLVEFENNRGNRQTAAAYLQRLIALDTAESGPELVAILFSCNAETLPPQRYSAALEKVATGRLTPFSINALSLLANQTLRGRCPALDQEQLMQLAKTAIGNQQTRRSHHCIASEIQVRLLIDQDDWAATGVAVDKGLDRCARATPYTVQFFVENILRFATCRDKMIETLDLLQHAAAKESRRQTLDRAYAGMGGFDLDKLLRIDSEDAPDDEPR
ncbi:MAG: hypothetical protein WBG92_13285, partial [Thiohalocapsa sp.]